MSPAGFEFAKFLDALREAPTSTISDALDTMGISGVMLGIHPIVPGKRFAGPALTAKEVTGPFGTFAVSDLRLDRLIEMAVPGDVILIDNGGEQVSTWGGVATAAGAERQLEAVVVDGGVRDVDRMRAIGLPVFSRHVIPLSPRTRVKLEAINVPVTCGGIVVNPGDILVGDDTGLLVVPRDRLGEVVERTRRIQEMKAGAGIHRFDEEGELWQTGEHAA